MVAAEKLNLEVFKQEKNQPIHQWAHQVLRTNMIELHVSPGQQLSENEVAEALGISRTPVREAFIRLAEDGLLVVTPQKRSIVASIDLDQAKEARFIRCAVEKAVFRQVCGKLSADADAELAANIEQQISCHEKQAFDQMLIVDNDFHRIIFKSCGKELSWEYLKRLDFNYDRLRIMVLPLVSEGVIAEHRKILELLRSGAVESIDAVVDGHLTWAAIDRVVYDYPASYFQQDLGIQKTS